MEIDIDFDKGKIIKATFTWKGKTRIITNWFYRECLYIASALLGVVCSLYITLLTPLHYILLPFGIKLIKYKRTYYEEDKK